MTLRFHAFIERDKFRKLCPSKSLGTRQPVSSVLDALHCILSHPGRAASFSPFCPSKKERAALLTPCPSRFASLSFFIMLNIIVLTLYVQRCRIVLRHERSLRRERYANSSWCCLVSICPLLLTLSLYTVAISIFPLCETCLHVIPPRFAT